MWPPSLRLTSCQGLVLEREASKPCSPDERETGAERAIDADVYWSENVLPLTTNLKTYLAVALIPIVVPFLAG